MKKITSVPLLLLGALPLFANSQDQGMKKQPANRLLEEVLVTAQKRSENVQDVPISIQAFTPAKLEAYGVDSIQDLQTITPGFTVTNNAGFSVFFLRGVGSDAVLPGVDSSVPFYVDGVPLLQAMGTEDTLGRIQRVEVLKGPQGTLFGRNATGGAISVITPDPSQEFEGDIRFGVAEYNSKNATAYINVPLTDTLAFNGSYFDSSRTNYAINTAGGVPDVSSKGGRLKIRWDITDTLSLTPTYSYQTSQGNGALHWQLLRPAPVFSAILPADPKFDRTISIDYNADGTYGVAPWSNMWGVVLDWHIQGADLKAIYSDQKAGSDSVSADFDGTAVPLIGANGGVSQTLYQESLELQVLSNEETPYGDRFQWATGVFLLEALGGFDPIEFYVAPSLLDHGIPQLGSELAGIVSHVTGILGLPDIMDEGIILRNYGLLESTSYSAFFQGTYSFGSTIDFTLGARYQEENRRMYGLKTTTPTTDGDELYLFGVEDEDIPELNPKQISARAALQWWVADGSQIYTSWARGWKNPTYNTVHLLGNTLDTVEKLLAEKVDTIELGLKSQLFDGDLQLNLTAFYTVQDNPLISRIALLAGSVTDFTNGEENVVKGIEGDFLFVPMPSWNPGLVISGSGSYIDATITKYENGKGFDETTGLAFGDGGSTALPSRDFSGNKVPRVPEYMYVLGINQRIDFDSGHALELGIDTAYDSGFYFSAQNSEFTKRGSVQHYNARISYIYLPNDFEITAYVKNITDELYAESAFESDFGAVLIADENPRVFGLRASISF